MIAPTARGVLGSMTLLPLLPLLTLAGCTQTVHIPADGTDDCPKVTWFMDADGDGFGGDATEGGCDAPDGFVTEGGDCDDADPAAHPDALERCNGVDDDCDGSADDGLPEAVGWLDADGDGYGDWTAPTTDPGCALPEGFVADDQDCEDADPAIHPGALEVCNGYDDDCDWLVDDEDTTISGGVTLYEDWDRDGYGNPDVTKETCSAEVEGYVGNTTDCDDEDDAVNPAHAEVCFDGTDNDCDAVTDDKFGQCAPVYDGSVPDAGVYPDPCDTTAVPVDVSLCTSGVAAVLPTGSTYPRVQDAMDAASPGDVVSVCPGTWAESLTQSVSPLILAGYGAELSVLDGAGARVIEMLDEGNDLVIADLTVQGGAADVGAGLKGNDATLCIARSTFADNVAADGGGAIYLLGSGSLKIDDSLFHGNLAAGYGGAIEIPGRTNGVGIEITDSLFAANAGDHGGAMQIDSTSAVVIANTGFTTNMAASGGGLDYGGSGPSETLELDSVTFSGNYAYHAGGGLHVNSSTSETVAVINCVFEDNETHDHGGALTFMSDGGVFTAVTTDFRGNISSYGGAVYAYVQGTEDLDFQECTFDSNTAKSGAALFLLASGSGGATSARATNSTFTANVGTDSSCGAVSLQMSWRDAVATLISVNSDWGSASTDNLPDDVCGYSYEAAASFECTDSGCL